MDSSRLYSDISRRTQGDIYIGVVGPVRTGKSTFIKKFLETLVLPNIQNDFQRGRAVDEMPQSAAGRTIMTAEPKFIPEEAVSVTLSDNATFKVKMIDCVGYIVPSALGYIENDVPRMVMTPWFDQPVPFNMAAEIGTKKVITDHSTIGLVVTTDGSFGELPRDEYRSAEGRVIKELIEINKPFAVILNCYDPTAASALAAVREITDAYDVPVLPVNCLELDETDIKSILETVLFEFPVTEIGINLPTWVEALDEGNPVKSSFYTAVIDSASHIDKIRQVSEYSRLLAENEHITDASVKKMDLGSGSAVVDVTIPDGLFFKVLSDECCIPIANDGDLMSTLRSFALAKTEYDKYANAIARANATGYGVVMPTIEEMSLEQPEIIKQAGSYGVRLKACAPSLHVIRADIQTEISPIIGTESQSEEFMGQILREFRDSPEKIWQSDIFGRSLCDLVGDGLCGKLNKMPDEARDKVRETLERIINDGSDGLVCIIL